MGLLQHQRQGALRPDGTVAWFDHAIPPIVVDAENRRRILDREAIHGNHPREDGRLRTLRHDVGLTVVDEIWWDDGWAVADHTLHGGDL